MKPENILLADGRALVAEFAWRVPSSRPTRGRLTATGVVVGSAHYLSPEQLRESPTSISGPTSTVWSGDVRNAHRREPLHGRKPQGDRAPDCASRRTGVSSLRAACRPRSMRPSGEPSPSHRPNASRRRRSSRWRSARGGRVSGSLGRIAEHTCRNPGSAIGTRSRSTSRYATDRGHRRGLRAGEHRRAGGRGPRALPVRLAGRRDARGRARWRSTCGCGRRRTRSRRPA